MSSTTRVALVTGAARGLGYEIARQLTARDLRVLVAARSLHDAGDAADRINDRRSLRNAEPIRLDVDDPASIDAAVAATLATHQRIDVLVNNAAITDGGQPADAPDFDRVSALLRTNLLGAWRCATAVIPSMRRHGYGRIVNVSSNLGSLTRMTAASEPAYRVSKAALNALTRVLAAQLDGTGILVNAASPGWVRTDMGGPNAPFSVQEGADTPVWLATLVDDGDAPNGQFFYQRHPTSW